MIAELIGNKNCKNCYISRARNSIPDSLRLCLKWKSMILDILKFELKNKI